MVRVGCPVCGFEPVDNEAIYCRYDGACLVPLDPVTPPPADNDIEPASRRGASCRRADDENWSPLGHLRVSAAPAPPQSYSRLGLAATLGTVVSLVFLAAGYAASRAVATAPPSTAAADAPVVEAEQAPVTGVESAPVVQEATPAKETPTPPKVARKTVPKKKVERRMVTAHRRPRLRHSHRDDDEKAELREKKRKKKKSRELEDEEM
jgi:hypothetical protein